MTTTSRRARRRGAAAAIGLAVVTSSCAGGASGADGDGVLTVHSGRGEDLVAQVVADFEEQSGFDVEVLYDSTSDLADDLVEDGAATTAEVFWAQDAAALARVARAGLLAELPDDLLGRVDERVRGADGRWVGVSGRVRVLVRSTERVPASSAPTSVLGLTDERWRGRVGWAPANASFQVMVTAMRTTLGEDATRAWLTGMVDNDAVVFPNNASQIEAIAAGEIDVGLVDHYHVARLRTEDPDLPVANVVLDGDIGGLLDVAGVGRIASSGDRDAAEAFVAYLLSDEVQGYVARVRDEPEYPLVADVEGPAGLPALEDLDPPTVDLSALWDVAGTRALLHDVGALP